MGIEHLWPAVKSTGQEISLMEMSLQDGFSKRNRTLLIGVDISGWIDSAQAGTHKRSALHTQAGENPQIQVVFRKLCRFLQAPVTLIFVFDGPARPSVKRGTKVVMKPLWVVKHIQSLIEAFGFYCHQAPGEAEAELATMNRLGLIDAIITEDSDTLVFGGQCIIRSLRDSSNCEIACDLWKKGFVRYSADTISKEISVNLTRGGLLLFALLNRGDYSDGIPGFGQAISLGLARCGFGDQLLEAANSSSKAELGLFLVHWREAFRLELRTNSHGFLPSKKPSLAELITDNFPDTDILGLYLHPTTSWFPEILGLAPSLDRSMWIPRMPNISQISHFCIDRFGWTESKTLLHQLDSKLWPALICRFLSFPLVVFDAARKTFRLPDHSISLVTKSKSRSPHALSGDLIRVKMDVSDFFAAAGLQTNKPHALAHVPECVLNFAMESNNSDTSMELTGKIKPPKREYIEVSDDSEPEFIQGSSSGVPRSLARTTPMQKKTKYIYIDSSSDPDSPSNH